ncbi:pyruvate kinase [Spiroplasma eriocheiris]|uniref:Pyruvate kinase n=1 Tax=Spiroplasma eriocheiris TaxID=315358 RepID=A0A0H3XK91_9MOLU|nr:pyruvate kinase [Spiroplasma eriocheiris]AHF57856.1 pyruvate kinase [Spiroplasma eriocheiris CCTCC M 207170]AKM54301.1 pyruvate kinase [Spiroplasma eriocheiris]
MTTIDLKDKMKRTKIITTIGPSTHSAEAIEELFNCGMTTIRLNFSHGDHEEQGARIVWAKQVREKIGKPISILLDTKGPEIRVGQMKDGKQEIKAGDKVTIYSMPEDYQARQGTGTEITVSYDMSQDLKIGDMVLVDDGKLQLNVNDVKPGVITTTAFNHHLVKTNKRINLPGVDFTLPFLAEKDINDIKYGIEQGIDYIAASFVNTAANIQEIRQLLKEGNAEHIQIIAKIESQIGINNIDAIIEAADGIMIARGDLGLEIPYYDVPYWEKVIIRKCRAAGKIVIVATQMLETMTDNPHPTRAEVTDVYFATELGADATMLSGESANGDYPFITVSTMATINKRAEHEFYSKLYYEKQLENACASTKGVRAEIARKLAEKSKDGDYEYAVVVSNTGELLKTISKFRPNVVILGVSPIEHLYTAFGVWHSIFMNKVANYESFKTDDNAIMEVAKKWGAKPGSKILFARNEELREITIK